MGHLILWLLIGIILLSVLGGAFVGRERRAANRRAREEEADARVWAAAHDKAVELGASATEADDFAKDAVATAQAFRATSFRLAQGRIVTTIGAFWRARL